MDHPQGRKHPFFGEKHPLPGVLPAYSPPKVVASGDQRGHHPSPSGVVDTVGAFCCPGSERGQIRAFFIAWRGDGPVQAVIPHGTAAFRFLWYSNWALEREQVPAARGLVTEAAEILSGQPDRSIIAQVLARLALLIATARADTALAARSTPDAGPPFAVQAAGGRTTLHVPLN